ncbi:acetyl-CoA carboxylase [Cyclospora cayetanensis]|uniref:Acetyl-CoA carboxylase n=1 Tax=Cyclospora cayetanensis TaxID=88456 RepID=A0A6P6S082_9EIME|nr:acetyl-CoA carboxylase [Cyclospora cayetanensis]
MDSQDPLATFVQMHGGSKPIRRILIANNGMAATKAIASMRQWAFETFGDASLLTFVAMATPEDLEANSEFLKKADAIVHVPGGPGKNNYGNVALICETAIKQKVDAVWPGWGHASENPELPSSLAKLGISFLGPKATVMAALGDKIAANILAQTANVPSIPWSGDGLKAQLNDEGSIPEEIFKAATISTVEECRAAADRVGYPFLLKASGGGGGKGIRLCYTPNDLENALAQVQGEVPGSPVFMMKLCEKARHIEVQIAGDASGCAVALSGRDCSTQRRFQKIFEEAPPTVVRPETFKEMERAAQRLTQSLGYEGLGTVEYLFNPATDSFYFLELNPRLQVEHPVTEAVTGQNLPALQLQIAMGIPLHRIPSIRTFFGRDPEGTDPIDFLSEDYVPPKMHVIAARVTAENPSDGFRPTSGALHSLDFHPPEKVWGYFSVGTQGAIHPYADSQFGHIFAGGATRNEARKRLIWGLQQLHIKGDIRTPVNFLQVLLQQPAFVNHTLNTEWLDGIIKAKELLPSPKADDVVFAAAAFRAIQALEKQKASWIAVAARGHTYLPPVGPLLSTETQIAWEGQLYKLRFTRTGPLTLGFSINKQQGELEYRKQSDGSYLLSINPEACQQQAQDQQQQQDQDQQQQQPRHPRLLRFSATEEPLGLRLELENNSLMILDQRDPSELRSDVNGRLVRFLVQDGETVSKGQPFAEVEAMKMILTLTAGESGELIHRKSAGSLLTQGELLASLRLADPSKVMRLKPFEGALDLSPPSLPQRDTDASDESAAAAVQGNVLPHTAAEEAANAEKRLELLLSGYVQHQSAQELVQSLLGGPSGASLEALVRIVERSLQQFLATEELFAGKGHAAAAAAVAAAGGDTEGQFRFHVSHYALKQKAEVLLLFLKELARRLVSPETPSLDMTVLQGLLRRVEVLKGNPYNVLALAAQRLRKQLLLPSVNDRVASLRMQLQQLLQLQHRSEQTNLQKEFLQLPEEFGGYGLLTQLFKDPEVGSKAQEMVLRRQLLGLEVHLQEQQDGCIPFTWRDTVHEGLAAAERVGLFAACSSMQDLQERLGSLLQQLHQQQKALGNASNSLLMLSVPPSTEAITAATTEDLAATVAAAAAKNPEAAAALKGLDSLRLLLPDGNGDTHQVALVQPKRQEEEEEEHEQPELLQEDPLQRNLSLSQAVFADLKRLQSEGTVRRLPSVAASAAVPPAASADILLHALTPKKPSAVPGAPATRRTPPLRDTVYVHRIVADAEPLLEGNGMQQLLQLLLQQLEAAFRDPHVHPTSSSSITLQLLPPQTEEKRAALQAAFFEGLQTLKATEGERLLQLNVEKLDLKVPQAVSSPGVSLEDTVPEQQVLRASSRGGCWLEPQETQGLPASALYDRECDLHTSPSAEFQAPQQQQLQPRQPELPLEVSTAESSTVPSPLPSELQTPETGGSREAEASTPADRTAAEQFRTSIESHSSDDFSVSWTRHGSSRGTGGCQVGARTAAAAEAERTAPLVVLKGINEAQLAAKRAAAQRAGSTYIYDFLGFIKAELRQQWQRSQQELVDAGDSRILQVPEKLVEAREFHMGEDGKLQLRSDWLVGDNKVGMVAFLLLLRTPEYPEGREVVLIGNDVTHQGGSFGVDEHELYRQASAFSRKHKLPRIYIACNSGARIGVYEQLKEKIQVEWNDPANPPLGFKHLFITEEDYQQLPQGAVVGHWEASSAADGKRVFVLDAIIGSDNEYLGVENLRGSGKIAGETSQAYDETFTLSLVSGRSVGIGAYVVRLAQRCIQQRNSPLVLTGYQALNKLLGREVYVSQDQLGGPEVMIPNGIAHLEVASDREGIAEVMKWLEFVPPTADDLHAPHHSTDPVNRDIEFTPSPTPYDPRHMLAGYITPATPPSSPPHSDSEGDESAQAPKERWISGFCDRDSFKEVLGPWGAGVVVGRARLGGQPIGVIAVDPRTTTAVAPADPANADSARVETQQAGQVWFPSSAYKTAQAIADFNRGENLPLIIFANWRGFSGGTRDMFNEVLKFGSMIVDALRVYRHPVFVYIPPHAELRGGSWVVIDPTINASQMELYADELARGGVLEPPGICEIKFREAERKKLMHKNDRTLVQWQQDLAAANTPEEAEVILQDIKRREEQLMPVYTQVAHVYADLHDRAPRMAARGGVREILSWPRAREFFYWRIRRRLSSNAAVKKLIAADPSLQWEDALRLLDSQIPQAAATVDDKTAVAFLDSKEGAEAVRQLLQHTEIAHSKRELLQLLQRLPIADRAEVFTQLKSVLPQ